MEQEVRKFGKLAETAPVIITEWTTSDKGKAYCEIDTPQAALKFLQYLETHGVGLTGFAYDFGRNLSGSVVVDFNGTPSTDGNGIECGTETFGPGTLIQKWFRTGSVPRTLQ